MSEDVLLSEAATRIGKSATTLRKLVNLGKLETNKDKQGRHWVCMNDVLAHYALTPAPRAGASRLHEHTESRGEQMLREHISFLEQALSRERAINDSLRTQNERMQSDATKTMAEMKAMLDKQSPLDGVISRWLRK